VVAADRAGVFQGSELAVAGGEAETDPLGEFGEGHSPVLVEARQGSVGRRHPLALPARGLEMLPPILDVAAGADQELANIRLALPDDVGDLSVVVIERFTQQEDGSLDRCKALRMTRKRRGRVHMRS
jgi:hypothetical protein